MLTWSKRGYRRWRSWTLPTRIGIQIGVAGLVLTILFALWDPRPMIERTFWPKPPIQAPHIVALIHNPEPHGIDLSYRDEFWLWLPSTGGAPRMAGKYEIIASSAGLVHDAIAPVKASGDTRLVVKLMNPQTMTDILKRGDTEICLIFHRPDGSSFISEDIPFTDEAIKKYYTRADATLR
jgi:hypothetical protein